MDFLELIRQLDEEEYFKRLALNPNAQFGSEEQPLLGATILPEQLVEENSFEETQVRYRTKPALDGTRYSPAQMQESSHLIGSVKVDLGDSDTANQFTGKDHDGLIKLLMRGGDEEAIARLVQWADKSLVRPHAIKNEIQRWQAIIKGEVLRKGSNGLEEVVEYYQHPGHHIVIPGGTLAAPQGWYNDNYDPVEDIAGAAQKLEDLGYSVRGMFSTGRVTSTLTKNGQVAKRTSKVVVNAAGQISGASGRVTLAELNAIADDDGLPSFTKYNAGYETSSGYRRFMDVSSTSDFLVIVGNSGRQWDMATDYAGAADVDLGDFADGAIQLDGILGYYGVGRNVGQSSPGRTVHTEAQQKKPAGLYGESYQTGFPVILDPQAIVVIEIQRPTP
jgi:Phage major capsid protein E